jgi:hypothetical protein
VVIVFLRLFDPLLKLFIIEVRDDHVAFQQISIVVCAPLEETDGSADLFGSVVRGECFPNIGSYCDVVIIFGSFLASHLGEIAVLLHFLWQIVNLFDFVGRGSNVRIDFSRMRPTVLFVFFGLFWLLADKTIVSDIVLPILQPFGAEQIDHFVLFHGSQFSGPFGEQLVEL